MPRQAGSCSSCQTLAQLVMAHRAPIVLSRYSDQWPSEFDSECALLSDSLRHQSIRVEHIGSTAVPGLSAKSIIDVMLGASSLKVIEGWVSILESLGYEYMPVHEEAIPDRRFFAKPRTRPRNIHLHGVVIGEKFWREHIAFRDALRRDPELAMRYESLKFELSKKFGDDRESYTSAKSPFISSVLRNALG